MLKLRQKLIREKLRPLYLLYGIRIILCFQCFFDLTPLKADSPQTSPTHLTKHIYAVHINTQDLQESTFFLQDDKGNLYCNSGDLEKWGFILPKKPSQKHHGENYYPLKAFEGLVYQIDPKAGAIHITSPSSYFKVMDVNFADQSFVVPEKPPLGGFVNYDTLAQKSNKSQEFRGYFSAGAFNAWGLGFSDFIVQRTENHHSHGHHHSSHKDDFVRLNSYWQYDIPAKLQTLIIGDSYTTPGGWGNAVGFGGIQFKTNFGTQPTFITFPLPSIRGDAVVPSVVDLYLNDALIKQNKANAGPFAINSIPVTTGAGDMVLVTTDLLGRQQQVTIPYYASTNLLKPGLQDYSYSAGFLRRNFGQESNDYDRFAFVGDHAVGLTEALTGEGRLELLKEHQTFGAGGNYLIDRFGVLNLAGAASSGSKGRGGLVSTGFQRQSTKGVNFGGNIQWTSKEFIQIGTCRKQSPKYLLTTFVGFNVFNLGSLGTSYIRQENRRGHNASLLTVSFNTSLSHKVSMNVSGMTNMGGRNHQSIFVTLSYALNNLTSLNAIGTAQKKGNQGTLQLTRNLPVGPGYGYNLYAANGQQENYQASFAAQNDIGTVTVSGAHQKGVNTGQVEARGAIAFLNGGAHLSRELGQSFAVVDVPGYPDVSIYSQNQYVGRTDSDGTLLVPKLLPYQKNPLRVELQDLPLDAEIQKAEMNPIPYFMTGLTVNFPIKPSAGAVMKLLLPSGEPVPVGSVVKFNNQELPIGYDGQLYATGLEAKNTLHVNSKGEQYSCEVQYQRTKEPIPDLGTIQCK